MSFRKALRRFGWCVALAGIVTTTGLAASASLVTSRAALAGDDFIDWGQLGAEFDPITPPAGITTHSGSIASVINPSGALYRVDQGSGSGGNFASGDRLLTTLFTPGPIRIVFAEGLSKVGAQIQVNGFGAFSGVISVYDATGALLESHVVPGASNGRDDGSAIFLGVSRSSGDIRRVDFQVSGSADPDFAINRVDLTSVPEPAMTASLMVGLSFIGLACSRGRARS